MSFELNGRLIEKYDTVVISDRFRKRDLVVEKIHSYGSGEFIDTIKFQLTQDRCEMLDNFDINEDIKVTFNIRGRKWEKDGQVNYFNNLEAWKLEKVTPPTELAPPPGESEIPPESENNLPF